MSELKKESPNLDNIDKKIREEFRYQEYIDSIRDLPYEVEDPVSSEEDEPSDHDQADGEKPPIEEKVKVEEVEVEEVEVEKVEVEEVEVQEVEVEEVAASEDKT